MASVVWKAPASTSARHEFAASRVATIMIMFWSQKAAKLFYFRLRAQKKDRMPGIGQQPFF